MNFLILINNAPEYITFFKKIGDELKNEGHTIIYACESHFPEFKYECYLKEEKKFYFNEFTDEINSKNIAFYEENYNLRSFYYSCYERNKTLNVNQNHNENMDQIIKRLLCFFENIFKNYDIDFVLYENISNSFAYAAYAVAKKNNKQYLGLISSRIPNRFEIWTDEYGDIESKKMEFLERRRGVWKGKENLEAINYLSDINNKKPSYMNNNPMSMDINYLKYYFKKINMIGRFIKYYIEFGEEIKKNYQSADPLLTSINNIKRNIKRKLKIVWLKKKFSNVNYNEKYYIFPLHYQPESSTLINAMYTVNQYESIKNISFSLPLNIKLYVKDHPNGIGFMSKETYKKILSLPNVKYIGPRENNFNLIKNSLGIITLTSTMGYEALLNQKPVVTLGKVFYNYHPYCFHTSSYVELYKMLQNILYKEYTDFEGINKDFINTYYNNTFDGQILDNSFENIEKIIEGITQFIAKSKQGGGQ